MTGRDLKRTSLQSVVHAIREAGTEFCGSPEATASNSAWEELGRASQRRTSVTQVLSEALKLREVEKDVPGSTNTVGKGNAAQNNMVLSWVPTHLF